MKRLFFATLSILSTIMLFAQRDFVLNKDGFALEDGKKYFVIDLLTKNTESIRNGLIKAVNSVLPSGTDSNIEISDDNEIRVSGVKTGLFKIKAGMMLDYIMDYDFTLIFKIKDGKVRIDAPIIRNLGMNKFGHLECRMVVCGDPQQYKTLKKNQFIYDPNNGSLRDKKTKAILEDYTNQLLTKIISELSTTEEDW